MAETCVQYGTFDNKIAVVVWLDIADQDIVEGSPVAAVGQARYQGGRASRDGRKVNWEAKTTDGNTGSVAINGAQYKLENGALFLVTTRGDSPVVRQVSYDVSKLKGTPESFAGLAKDRPEVKEYLAEASRKR